MEQFYAYTDAIKYLDKSGNVEEITKKLDQLWTKLYVYEKANRKRLIAKINECTDFTLGYTIDDLFIKLDSFPFYFFDVDPVINDKILSNNELELLKDKKLTNQEIKMILNTIVQDGRKYLINEEKVNIKRDSLSGLCINTSEYLHFKYRQFFSIYILETKNIYGLISDNFSHEFCVIELNSIEGIKRYIVDLTYRQFCLISKCKNSRIYHIHNNFIAPGYFFKDKNELANLLADGYLEINEKIAKVYGESFVLARNTRKNLKKGWLSIEDSTDFSEENYVKSLIYGTKVE